MDEGLLRRSRDELKFPTGFCSQFSISNEQLWRGGNRHKPNLSPPRLAGKPIVFVASPDRSSARGVRRGLLDHLGPNVLVIDSTTTDPAASVRLEQAVAARGSRYLDAPVFGSKSEAWEGRLDFVCGGSEACRAVAAQPGCDGALHRRQWRGRDDEAHRQSAGRGADASLGEALALARRPGLNGEAVVRVFDVTDYSSGLIRGVSRASLHNDFSPSFYLRHMLKDLRLIEDLARRLAVPLPATASIGPLYQAAVNEGFGDLNASGVHRLLFFMSGFAVPLLREGSFAQIPAVRRRLSERIKSTRRRPSRSAPLRAENTGKRA